MEETDSEIFLRTCTKHEDIGSIQSPRGNKDSCKVQKRIPSCVHLSISSNSISSALIAEYLMKPARNSKNIYIYMFYVLCQMIKIWEVLP